MSGERPELQLKKTLTISKRQTKQHRTNKDSKVTVNLLV